MNTDPDYFGQDRREMLRFLPGRMQSFIDIGCGKGLFAALVKQTHPGCEVWGLEPSAAASEAAPRCDRFVGGPFAPSSGLPAAYFDTVVMNDVLEHLTDTEAALALARQILKPDGTLVLSLPNVAFYLVVRDLIFRNEWEYQDFGVLDRTHVRFFTEKSARRAIERNGFHVRHVESINPVALKLHYRILFMVLGRIGRPMRCPQFALIAQPAPGQDEATMRRA
jgi:SAM-dependent methyltransferase